MHILQGGHPPGKPGKDGEFDIGRGKVGEIVIACGCAAAVVMVISGLLLSKVDVCMIDCK